tara:strand:+ start:6131 stop:6388 length:258 start_codon:yes stop_codon:yes gene_type:complete
MSRTTLVVEYQFDDPRMNVVVDNPSEDEIEFVRAISTYDGRYYPNYGGLINNLGIIGIKITSREWNVADLFDGGTSPEDPIRPRN